MVSDVFVISAFFLMLLCPCLVGLHASLSEESSKSDPGVTSAPSVALAPVPAAGEGTARNKWASLLWMKGTLSGLLQVRVPSATVFLLGCVLGAGATLVATHAHPSMHHPTVKALRLSETALWLTDSVGSGWAR